MCTLAQRTPRACKLSWYYFCSESCARLGSNTLTWQRGVGCGTNSWSPSCCQVTCEKQACYCWPCARHHIEAQSALL